MNTKIHLHERVAHVAVLSVSAVSYYTTIPRIYGLSVIDDQALAAL